MNEEEIKKRFEKIERRLDKIEGKKIPSNKEKEKKTWYKKNSTVHKILILVDEGFFDNFKTISEMITELKSKDYHLRASDLTLPLRRIVRKSILKKTKTKLDSSKSKNWLYIKK